jgi:hypothetical protein
MSVAVACSLVIAGVCLTQAKDIHMTGTDASGSAMVHAADYDAEIVYPSDARYPADWKRMQATCWDGVCVAYHKWCREDGVFCRYHFSRLGEMHNAVIEVTSPDHAALLRAEEEIGVIAGSGWSMTKISLKWFDLATPWEYPPYCNEKPRPACWPSPLSR